VAPRQFRKQAARHQRVADPCGGDEKDPHLSAFSSIAPA
jgi:hypothetical protein